MHIFLKKFTCIVLIILVFFNMTDTIASNFKDDVYDVILFFGQSNMLGFAYPNPEDRHVGREEDFSRETGSIEKNGDINKIHFTAAALSQIGRETAINLSRISSNIISIPAKNVNSTTPKPQTTISKTTPKASLPTNIKTTSPRPQTTNINTTTIVPQTTITKTATPIPQISDKNTMTIAPQTTAILEKTSPTSIPLTILL